MSSRCSESFERPERKALQRAAVGRGTASNRWRAAREVEASERRAWSGRVLRRCARLVGRWEWRRRGSIGVGSDGRVRLEVWIAGGRGGRRGCWAPRRGVPARHVAVTDALGAACRDTPLTDLTPMAWRTRQFWPSGRCRYGPRGGGGVAVFGVGAKGKKPQRFAVSNA